MTLKKFFMGRAIVFAVIVIIAIGIWIYKTYAPTKQPVPATTAQPAFAWRYEKADSLNPDGIPQTIVFLNAQYANGSIQDKKIDTTDGSCYDLPDADKDSVPHTTTIQCYAAGFGYNFKIVKGNDSYLVERKTIEEGSPDYTPPAYQYEVVAQFPF